MSKRLSMQPEEWINRNKPIEFNFEGQRFQGYEGDTITSALWANGQHVLGRSFKYHRPRGVLSFANHDVNMMVTDGEVTNIRADVVQLKAGMALEAVNTSGGVKRDRKRFLDKISTILPVGFYYKAFFKPKRLFPFWENIIRRSAGLGKVNVQHQHHAQIKTNQFADVLVIGAGMSGMHAALKVASASVNVVLVDENPHLGGSLNDDYAGDNETKATRTFLTQAVAKNAYITVIKHAYVAGYYADNFVPIITQNGMVRLRAKAVIVATGAFEQPPVFRNNDLPGVMLSTAAQRLIHRYRVAPFNHGVVCTANSQGYRVALDLLAAGIKVEALIDLRAQTNEPLAEKVAGNHIAIYRGYCVYEVTPSASKLGVKAARICKYDEATATPDTTTCISIPCDGIAMSAGWSPAAALLYQAGTKMRFDDGLQQFVPKTLPAGIFAAGKVNGVFDQIQRGLDGERAASEVLAYLNKPSDDIEVKPYQGDAPSHPYPIVPHHKGKNFIDFDEDIQLKDFLNAAQEGFDNIELMKRFTTFGMGPSQGKHANMNAIRVLARIRQLPVEKVGSTTARPFYHPTTLASLAGHHFTPYRHTTLHQWHARAGAIFTQVGSWMRPAYYQKNAETEQVAVEREVFAVRNHAGLIDVSTLGKIEVHGPDAGLLLDRFYTGRFTNQAVGTTRYAVAVDETGVLLDDGVVARLAKDSFYLTTTTSNSALIYRELLRWIAIWQLDTTLINVTTSVAAINLAGKQAKTVLAKLVGQATLVDDVKVGVVGQFTFSGIPVRVMGVKFVSDIAFELHLPSSKALELWEALMSEGETVGVTAVGITAQRLLRLEMGHPIIGHDTDGLTTPFEAGLSFALDKQKAFFIGQRSLSIIAKKPLDKKLVCFTLTANTDKQLPKECNLVIAENTIVGRVTSIAFSQSTAQNIGMAYVLPSQSDVGAVFNIRTDDGAVCQATVIKPPFIDWTGAQA